MAKSGTTSGRADAGASTTASLESLFVAHEVELLVYARHLVTQDETAQDLVQEAFVRLQDQTVPVRQPRAWLYRTIHNLALNHLRASQKLVPFESGGAPAAEANDDQPLPNEYLERLERIGQTRICLEALDARSRQLLRLKFEEDLSYQDISQRTRLSVGNVGYLLHHALKNLARELKKNGVLA